MQSTRRTFLGSVGAAAVAAAATPPAAKVAAASENKCLFWVAAATPCDKNLKFDEALYKDMMAYFKDNGADGVVVLGTTGEYPSFSVAERKKVAETALKHRNGLLSSSLPAPPIFPRRSSCPQHAAANGADGLLIIPPFYYKNPPLEGLTKYYSLIFDQVKIPINLYHIPGTSGVPITPELLHSLEHYPQPGRHQGLQRRRAKDTQQYRQGVSEAEHAHRHGQQSQAPRSITAWAPSWPKATSSPSRSRPCLRRSAQGKDIDEPLAKLRAAQQLLRPGGVGSYGPMKYALSLHDGDSPDVSAAAASGRHR